MSDRDSSAAQAGGGAPTRPAPRNAAHLLALLRQLHRWLGLALAAPLLLMGATGFILLIIPTLQDLTAPPALPPATGQEDIPSNVVAIMQAARAAVSQDLAPIRYQPAGHAAQVDFARPAQFAPSVRVLVDPATLTVRNVINQPDRFYRWVHSLHENLLIPSAAGHSIVGFIGIFLFCLGVLGIPIWWPRNGRWKAALTVSGRARGYLLHRQLHGAAGIWIAAMLLLQSISGASMAFPQTVRALLGVSTLDANPPTRSRPTTPQPASTPAALTDSAIEQLVGNARAAVPDASLIDLRLPAVGNRPIRALLRPSRSANGSPAVIVTMDRASLRVTAIQDPRRTGPGLWLLGWLRALHSGDGLGPVWRIAVGVLGLTLPLLSVTGLAMWLFRRTSRRRRTVSPQVSLQRAGE